MRLLVSNCHTRMGYAVTCSLTRMGHEVVAAGSHVPTMARGVHSVVGEVFYPDPFIHEDEFVRVLSSAIRDHAIDALLPVHEETFVVARHRHCFAPTLVIAPGFDDLMRAQDKYEVFRLANVMGVPTPMTHVLNEGFDLRHAVAALGYPLIIKPRFGSGAHGVVMIRTDADLPLANELMRPESNGRLIAQEWVPGHGAGIGILTWGQRLAAVSGHKRIREIPISGGTSTARITFTSEPLIDAADRILSACSLQGVAMVEFRVDEETGRHWLLEINPRYWGGLPTAIASGVDFPVHHVNCAMGRVPASILRPRHTIESRWLLGEIRAFAEHIRTGNFSRAFAAFRVTPGACLTIDDIGQAGARAFFYQLGAYMSNLRRYGSMGGHSDCKARFFERHTMMDRQA